MSDEVRAPGEGLEKDLTDIECDDIGRACIVANMKRGEPGQAVLATAQAVYKKLKTGTTGIQENTDEDAGAGLAIVLFTVICIVVVLVILNRRDNRGKGGGGGGGSRRSGGPFIIWGNPGHTNDSGSGWGGGFSGGSFGGGSFGGGGAGGGW